MRFLLILLFSFSHYAMAHTSHKSPAQPPAADVTTFGDKVSQTKLLTLNDVISNFDAYKGKTIAIEATPEKVCKKKGCWMVLKDGDHEVRTLFKDYGFFVPPSIVGKKVKLQGQMKQEKVSAATIRHFMKDDGKKMSDIEKVKKGQIKFQFVADGVEII